MKEFKGTKGKWYTIENNDNILISCDNPNWHICETLSNLETDKSNAKLIASAPEMFEMLKDLQNEFKNSNPPISKEIEQLLTKITE